MQLRRVLLLFALVLGLSAVVAALAPPPDEENKRQVRDTTVPTLPEAGARDAARMEFVRFKAPSPTQVRFKTPTKLVREGSALTVEVRVQEPGDVALDGLGLRESADPRTPARFELLASPAGSFAVMYFPIDGDPRLIGRLQFGG